MKKNVIFIIPMLMIIVLLFMLKTTGMKVHIAVSFIGLVILVAYTIVSRKGWKNPALEIFQRLCYAIALITGVVLMNVHGVLAISIAHKLSAVLFVIVLIVCEIQKIIKNR